LYLSEWNFELFVVKLTVLDREFMDGMAERNLEAYTSSVVSLAEIVLTDYPTKIKIFSRKLSQL